MRLFYRTLIFSTFFISSLITRNEADAGCPPLPDVEWWGTLTHASIVARVMKDHDGDWDAYIAKWDGQHKKIEKIYFNDGAVTIKKDDTKLSGPELETYVGHIEKRVDITRCLAGLAKQIGLRPGNIVSPKSNAKFNAGLKAYQAKDYQKAVSHLKPLAEAGYTKAQNALGFMHRKGMGVSPDFVKAQFWYRESAKLGDATGQYSYGEILRKSGVSSEDMRRAQIWLERSANQGNAQAQISLGNIFYNGDGVDKSLLKAAFWFGLAKDKNRTALDMYNLVDATMTRMQRKKALYLRDNWLAEHAPDNS